MEEYTQITLDQWTQWKEDIRHKLTETAGNFVYIGYRLKQIRDSGMYDGAADVFEFAQNEYGLGKSTVSRFIAINEKYSEGGNSLELRAEFRGFSSSKLSEMLTLPDSECQLITERTTVKEIRELKNFDRQQASEDVEQCADNVPHAAEDIVEAPLTPLQKCIRAFFEPVDKREVLNKVLELINNAETDADFKAAYALVNPADYGTFKKGIIFVFMYDYQTGVKYKSMMEPQPIAMSWAEFLLEVKNTYPVAAEDGNTWGIYYHEEEKKEEKIEPKKEAQKTSETEENKGFEGSVATSQQTPKTEKKEEEKTAKNEQSEPKNIHSEPENAHSEPENAHFEPENAHFETKIDEEGADEQEDEEEQSRGTAPESEKREAIVADSNSEELSTGTTEICTTKEQRLSIEEKDAIWKEVEEAVDIVDDLTCKLYLDRGEERDFDLENLREAYKAAINLAAGLEKLLRDKEKEE